MLKHEGGKEKPKTHAYTPATLTKTGALPHKHTKKQPKSKKKCLIISNIDFITRGILRPSMR